MVLEMKSISAHLQLDLVLQVLVVHFNFLHLVFFRLRLAEITIQGKK